MFEERIIAAAPGGSFFTTGGNKGKGTANVVDLNITESFTISAWIRINNSPALDTTAGIFRATPLSSNVLGQIALQVINENGDIFIRGLVSGLFTGSTVVQKSDTFVTSGRWYNITLVKFFSNVMRLFVNGREDADIVVPPFTNSLFRRLSFGHDSTGIDQNFDGDIDSLAIWNSALSEEDVRSIYNNGWTNLDLRVDHPCYSGANNLVHWWLFGQGAQGSFAGDSQVSDWGSTTNSIPLLDTLGVVTDNDILTAKFPQTSASGSSLLFNEDGFIQTAVSQQIGISNNFTISFWLNVREILAEQNTVLYIGPEAPNVNNSITVSIDGTQAGNPLFVDIKSSVGVSIFTALFFNSVTVGEWSHYTLTFSNTVVPFNTKLFKDGEEISGNISVLYTGNRNNSGVFLEIGGSEKKVSPETNFKGQIGHVGIWDSVLSDNEIFFLATQGYLVDLRYNNISYQSAENLKRYYKLGEDVFSNGRDFVDTLRLDTLPLLVESSVAASVTPVVNSPFQSVSPAQPLPPPPPPPESNRSVDISADSSAPQATRRVYTNTTPALLSFSNVWTVTFWIKPQVDTAGGVFNVASSSLSAGGLNSIAIAMGGGSPGGILIASVGSTATNLTWNISDFLNIGQWNHVALVRDLISHSLFLNGLEFSELDPRTTFFSESIGPMTDTARTMIYGSSGTVFNSPQAFLGHLALWDSALTASEIVEISSKGHSIDLRLDSGDYNSSSSLIHYYRPGFGLGNIDEGVKTVPRFDFSTLLNLSEDNIKEDAPPL